jgi:hypothetical protein
MVEMEVMEPMAEQAEEVDQEREFARPAMVATGAMAEAEVMVVMEVL